MSKIDVNSPKIIEKSNVLKVLSHPIRFSIAVVLHEKGTMNVGAIQESLSLPQSTVSQHISKMRAARIVEAQRDGTRIFYSLLDEDTIKMMECLVPELLAK